MKRERFEEIVHESLKKLPRLLRNRLINVEIIVEDEPVAQKNLLGLYQGIPLKKRGFWYGNVLPDKIIIFKTNIERLAGDEKEIKNLVYEVLLHEIGHYLGFDEEDLQNIASNSDKSS
ncbi:MAG: metallopeptidase family protein [candidate division WOR-3 bacterium]|nr:metallopeptidase family protein [candidate division WOR-3 bacterium]